MKQLLLLFLVFITISCTSSNEYLVDYYESLIKENIQRASTYQFPENAEQHRAVNDAPVDFGTFDFVVIGGGSAGAVAASRLSEIGNWKVLLLEAGKNGNEFTDIPSMSVYVRKQEYNWGFNSTPQTTCCLASGGICPYPRGKGLGGTSTINGLIYVRGNKLDYDRWGAAGNEGWYYDDVLPFFKKSENSKIFGDHNYEGVAGLLNVEYHYPSSPKSHAFFEANAQLGEEMLDYNGKKQLGVSFTQFTTANGRRMSSANAFLTPAIHRHNLRVLTNSLATKILISESNKKATGVLFSLNKIQYMARIRKEVVISGGVFGSPQLLMMSGIGPAKDLQQHNIKVIKDLAVGKQMEDHFVLRLSFRSRKSESTFTLREAIRQYLRGVGPLTISRDNELLAFYHTSLDNSSLPEVEILMSPSIRTYGTEEITTDTDFDLTVILLHPKTVGSVHLKSSDPYEYPIINAKCFADPENKDIEQMYVGVQKVLQLINTSSFQKLGAELIPYQPCYVNSTLSKDYWFCVIRHVAESASHGSGTCRMGTHPDKGHVVDNKLRVHGINNLRVADTSVIPVTLAAHMNAPAMMIGERVAHFIKEEYVRK